MSDLQKKYYRDVKKSLDDHRNLMDVQRNRIDARNKEIEELSKRLKAAHDDCNFWKRELSTTEKAMKSERERLEKNYISNVRRKAKKIATQYNIEIENDSHREYGEYHLIHYIGQPDWLQGDDPLDDGHYAYDWEETLWLVEFYAKWHPDHPEYEQRKKADISPWN